MSTTISPLRRITVTLALTGAAAFSAVAIAPSAFADDSTAAASSTSVPAVTDAAAPAVTDPATAPAVTPQAAPVVTDPAVVTPPAPVVPPIVYDKHGKALPPPKVCDDHDLTDSAKKVAEATKKVAPLLSQAASLHKAAGFLRAHDVNMTAGQKNLAELVAKGLDSAGDKVAAQAQASIDKAAILNCWIVSTPGGRF